MRDLSRRNLLQTTGVGALLATLPLSAHAAGDAVSIGWPSDVPSWDPNQRFVPDAQSIFKMVYDQPLDQAPDLKLIPHLLTKWEMGPDAKTFTAEMRDDATWHNGDRVTSADFRYTFFERIKSGVKLDTVNIWRKVTDIETPTPTRIVMHLDQPSPTVPAWLCFLGSYVVPKAYIESVGADAFAAKPIGSGPYKLAEYELNSRIVLERNDAYWGPKPKLRRVTIQIIKDPSARVAAIQSGEVDLTVSVPVREVTRLKAQAGLSGEFNPISRVILLQCRNDLAFSDPNVRLAAHHAIDKVALSKAFYAGAAVPLSEVATPGGPGYDAGYKFAYDPELSKTLLAKSGYGPDKPIKLRMAATNGQFPNDYDIARAIVAMWKKVGIDGDIDVIEYAKYFELNRGGKLPETTLYSFDNATNDPEIFAYTLNPKLPFTPWKGMEIGQKVIDLNQVANEAQRIAGWRALLVEAAETGASIPLLQSVQTLVRKSDLAFTPYGNGWVLGQTMAWT